MFSFIVLHYKNISETINCLEAIKKLDNYEKVKIIIVSNAPLSADEKKKLAFYTKDIIINKENLGFAKANNIGCRYAIKKYHPSYLVVLNNDVIIEQENFIELIENDFQKYKFDILGPKINSPSGESVNPFPVFDEKVKIKKEIAKNEKIIKIYSSPVLTFLFQIYHNLKYTFIKAKKSSNSSKLEKNVALHGCALIFSKNYYKIYNDIFYNDTFLYHEEEFLYARIKKDKLTSIYDPKIEVFHKEGASLNVTFNKNKREKMLFKYKTKNESLKKLLKYIEC